MGTLNVFFKGICTHFGDLPSSPLHTTVLVNANGNNIIEGLRIAPHFARMTVYHGKDPNGQTFDLQGVEINVQNVQGSLTFQPDYDIVPHLETQLIGIEPLPPQVASFSWPLVAATFNTTGGEFTACVSMNAAAVSATIDTTDTNVLLTVSPLPGAPPLTIPSSFELPSGSTINFSNLATLANETPENWRGHFLLHYLLCETFPAAPQAPLSINGPQCTEDYTIDAGCSDSNYP